MKHINRKQRRYLGEEPPVDKVFKQTDVDGIVQKRIAEAEKKFNATRATDLERMKSLETDAQAKGELEKQIEELNNRYKSKDELAQDAYKKEKATWEERNKKSSEELGAWRKRYEETLLSRELTDAAADKEADVRSIEQVTMLLRPRSRVVQKLVDGKQTDEFETRVKYHNGKEEIEVTPAEAIKLMKNDPKRWGNLFNSGVAGGLGGKGSAQPSGPQTLMGMSQDEFNKAYIAGTLPKKAK